MKITQHPGDLKNLITQTGNFSSSSPAVFLRKLVILTMVLIVIMFAAFIKTDPVSGDTTYESYTTGGDYNTSIFGTYLVAQTFSHSTPFMITAVKLLVWRSLLPGTGTVAIRATSGGVPAGNDLASCTYNFNTLTTSSSGAWVTFTFNSPYLCLGGVTYSIVMSAPSGDNYDCVFWIADSTSPTYTNGTYCYNWGSWIANASYDCLFEIHGNPLSSYETLKQSYDDNLYNYAYSTYSQYWCAQSWTTNSDSYFLSSVTLFVNRTSGTAPLMTVRIETVSGDTPTGTILATGNATITNLNATWVNFPLTGCQLSGNTKYAIVASSNGVAVMPGVIGGNTPGYASGKALTSSNSGTSWTDPNKDFCFKTYGLPISAPDGVLAFTLASYSNNTTVLNWTLSANAISARLIRSYVNEPVSVNSSYDVYDGSLLTFTDIGIFPYVDVYYRIYEWNYSGYSTNYAEILIGRSPMNVTINTPLPTLTVTGNQTIDISLALIGIFFGLVLILINLKLKMALIWWAAAICFIGVYFEPTLQDTYYRVGAGLLILACLILGTFRFAQKRSGRAD